MTGEDGSAGRQHCGFEDQSRRREIRTRIDYGRWLRERDTKELVYAIGRLSYKLALIKRDDRTGVSFRGRGSQDWSSRSTNRDKQQRDPKKSHNCEGE